MGKAPTKANDKTCQVNRSVEPQTEQATPQTWWTKKRKVRTHNEEQFNLDNIEHKMKQLNNSELIQAALSGNPNREQANEIGKRINQDNEFVEQMLLEKLIYLGAIKMADTRSQSAILNARKTAFRLGEDLFLDEDEELEAIEVDIDIEETYSLEELLSSFQPIDYYEQKILSVQRSGAFSSKKKLPLIHPKNGIEAIGLLKIEWNEIIDTTLKINILDSEDELVEALEIEQSKKTIINIENLKPGRYYLKIRAEGYAMEMRSFFVKKYLLNKL